MLSVATLSPELKGRILQQDGLVLRAQLRDSGLTRGELRWALDRRWRYVLPGVIATFTGRLDDRQRLVAACLYGGEHAVVTSSTAARWRGLTNVTPERVVRLVVPAARSARSHAFVVVRRTHRIDRLAWRRGPLLIASPQRAVADAARDCATSRLAVALVVEAVQRRIVTTDALRHELEAGPRAGSRFLRDGLVAAESGAWSLPEQDLLHALRSSTSLPEVWPNARLTVPDGGDLPTPDGWIDDVALAIQVHSRRHHALGDDFEGTVTRDGVFAEYGVPLVAFTPRRIRENPAWVRQRVERIHRRLLAQPRPEVSATPVDEGTARRW